MADEVGLSPPTQHLIETLDRMEEKYPIQTAYAAPDEAVSAYTCLSRRIMLLIDQGNLVLLDQLYRHLDFPRRMEDLHLMAFTALLWGYYSWDRPREREVALKLGSQWFHACPEQMEDSPFGQRLRRFSLNGYPSVPMSVVEGWYTLRQRLVMEAFLLAFDASRPNEHIPRE